MKPSFVIGISSPSGGGKTTLARRLANALADAVVLSFDEYDEAGLIVHPASYQSWYQQGADYNAWQAPQLATDLRQLKAGAAVTSPVDQRPVEPARFIVFDAPLGRAHHATGQQIDLMVYLDTPLDVALARRILRDFYGNEPSLSTEKSAALRRELEGYLQFARIIYVEFVRQLKSTSDLILDGLLAPDELANQVIQVAALASSQSAEW
jgi:uridine kinase